MTATLYRSGMETGPVRVMLVDDDDKFRELLRRMLDDDGFDVVSDVADATTAAKEIVAVDPDVVVVDYTLPDGDGLRLADNIRHLRPEQSIIVFSSLFDLTLRRRAEDQGFFYVEKVDGIDVLEATIAHAMAGHGGFDDPSEG